MLTRVAKPWDYEIEWQGEMRGVRNRLWESHRRPSWNVSPSTEFAISLRQVALLWRGTFMP